MTQKTKTVKCSMHIADYRSEGDVFLPPNEEYTLTIDYPLERAFKFKIKTGKSGLGTNALIGKICKLYWKIYEKEDEDSDKSPYGIYGHSIDDLKLTEIKVNFVKKTIEIDVDS